MFKSRSFIVILLIFLSICSPLQIRAEKSHFSEADQKLHHHFRISSDFPILISFIQDHLGPGHEKELKSIEASLVELNEKWEAIQKYRHKDKPIDDPHKIHLLGPEEFKEMEVHLKEEEKEELERLFHEIKRFIDQFHGLRIFKEKYLLELENETDKDYALSKQSHIAKAFYDIRKGVFDFFSKVTEKMADNRFSNKIIEILSQGSDSVSEGMDVLDKKLATLKEEIISTIMFLEDKILHRSTPQSSENSDTEEFEHKDLGKSIKDTIKETIHDVKGIFKRHPGEFQRENQKWREEDWQEKPKKDSFKDKLHNAKEFIEEKKVKLVDSVGEGLSSFGEKLKSGKEVLTEKVGNLFKYEEGPSKIREERSHHKEARKNMKESAKEKLHGAKELKDKLYEQLEEGFSSVGEKLKSGKDYLEEKKDLLADKVEDLLSGHYHSDDEGEEQKDIGDHGLVERDEKKMQLSDRAPPDLTPHRRTYHDSREEEHFESRLDEPDYIHTESTFTDRIKDKYPKYGGGISGENVEWRGKEIIMEKLRTGKDYIQEKIEDIENLARSGKEYLKEKVGDIGDIAKSGKEYMEEKLESGKEFATEKGKDIYYKAKNTLKDPTKPLREIKSKLSENFEKAEESLRNILGHPKEKVESVRESIEDKWSEGTEYLKKKVGEGMEYFTEKKDELVNKVIDISDELHGHPGRRIKEKAEEVVEEVKEQVKEPVKGIYQRSKEVIKDKIGQATDFVSDKFRDSSDYLSGTKERLKAKVEEKLISDREKILHEAKHPEGKEKVPESESLVGKTGELLREGWDKTKSLLTGEKHHQDHWTRDEPHNSPLLDFEDFEDYWRAETDDEELEDEPYDENLIGKAKELIQEKVEKVKDYLPPYKDEDKIEFSEEDEDLVEVGTPVEKGKEKQKGKKKILETGEDLISKMKKTIQGIKEELRLGGEGKEKLELEEKEIIDELIHHFNPSEPHMKKFIDEYYASKKKPEREAVPETHDSLWRRVIKYFKYRFPVEGWTIPKEKPIKYVEVGKDQTIHPHHLDEKHLKPDHIYLDDDKDYLKDKRNLFLDEITGRDDLFYYLADRGIDYYDVRTELMNYLVEGTDSEMSNWDDDPSLKGKR